MLLLKYTSQKNHIGRLDFRSPELSKRLNRMIQNFGNGAKNILKRSSLGSLYLTKKQVLKMLIERYLERYKGCKSPLLWIFSKVIHTLRIILIIF
jgi:putative transposase